MVTKVLHIIPSLAKGGAERLVVDICRELSLRKSIEVYLVTFSDVNTYQFLTSTLSYKVIPSKVIPSIKSSILIDVEALQTFIDDFQPDVIHSHLFETEMILSAINYKKSKHFVHFHDNMKQFENLQLSTFQSKLNFTNYFEKIRIIKKYSKKDVNFIAISKDTFDFVTKTTSDKFPKHLLHNAIDIKRFLCNNGEREKLRLVIIGSLVEKKGQELAIIVVKILHDRGLKVKLDILGDGPDFYKLQSKIDDFQLSEFIKLHGNVDYPENYLCRSTLYLHTAIYEPFGLVLIEAMASGLPIVCTDARGNRDLIVEGENGFMISDRNPNSIADKIELLLKDDKLWKAMSEKAVAFSKQFDISLYVDSLVELYNVNNSSST